MDVINLISKPPGLPDGDAHELTNCGPRIHEFLQEMHREVFAGRDAELLTVGEMPGVTVEEAVRFTDPARAEVDMVFQFEHVRLDQGDRKWDVRPLRLRDLKASMERWQVGLAERGWNSLYWNNHDQPRAVSRYGDDGEHRVRAAKLLGTVLHLQRGTPYVYQGEELGMTNAPFAGVEDFRDIESLNHYAEAVAAGDDPQDVLAAMRTMGRDNARTPMQWDASAHAGFTTGEPWLPLVGEAEDLNVETQAGDPRSTLSLTRRLAQLRRDIPALQGGTHRSVDAGADVFAWVREGEGGRLLAALNFAAAPAPLAVREPVAGATLILSTDPDREDSDVSVEGLVLSPGEGILVRLP
jgi:oligo-1,6-glucosidase